MGSYDDAPPSSSMVREAALAWHRDVRRALARGLRAVASAQANHADANEQLCVSAAGIAAVVRRQVAAEDINLAPILLELDAWGAMRKDRLDVLHAREQAAVNQALAATGSTTQAAQLGSAIREILRVLRLEEKELLDADLLDDSTTVSRGQSAG